MKNLLTILCLLCFAGCASAEMYQIPGSYKETTTQVTVQQGSDGQAVETETKKERKWFRRRIKDLNPTNSYWHFGKPPFWTGTI